LIGRAPTRRLRGDDLVNRLWFALQSVQLCLFLCNSPVKVLALKFSELRSEQLAIALNIPPMAQNFGGTEVSHHRHLVEMVNHCPSGWGGEFAATEIARSSLDRHPARPVVDDAGRPAEMPARLDRWGQGATAPPGWPA
jgi:hypothetical protein